ncbi:MAG TPA: OmpA family protein [Chthoniobacterales bacterium]|nr:OmpA family protein [Chthoniobacterales bacterium]
MNHIGACRLGLRQIALSILLCHGGIVFAQDEAEPPPGSGREIKPPAIDLVYQSLDLDYPSEALVSGGVGTGGGNVSATGGAVDLKSQVVDLVAKGVDIKETANEIKINLLGDILFDFDKADIRSVAEPTLADIAKLIQSRPKARVVIDGHTDSKGSDGYNAKLSERRAGSVKSWFGKHGVNISGMQTHGWGAKKPVASNTRPDGSDDPDGRQKNRRVEITIRK